MTRQAQHQSAARETEPGVCPSQNCLWCARDTGCQGSILISASATVVMMAHCVQQDKSMTAQPSCGSPQYKRKCMLSCLLFWIVCVDQQMSCLAKTCIAESWIHFAYITAAAGTQTCIVFSATHIRVSMHEAPCDVFLCCLLQQSIMLVRPSWAHVFCSLTWELTLRKLASIWATDRGSSSTTFPFTITLKPGVLAAASRA